MGKFAKIFDLPDDHQLLVTKEWDESEDKDKITQRIFYSGLHVSLDVGFKNEKAMHEAFEKYDKEKAETCFTALQYIIPKGE